MTTECYECEREVAVVYADSRCEECTRLKEHTARHSRRAPHLMRPGDAFTFGKYKGTDVSLDDAIRDDPDYIVWLEENGVASFDDEVHALIARRICRG